MPKFKRWLLFLIVTVVFYGSSIFYGFSQDDFFHLVIAQANNLGDIARFFLPNPEAWVFYRPLSTQLWYWLFDSFFGWQNSPFPMHVAALVLHSLNAYLISSLLEKVFKFKARLSLLGGALYAASSVHFLSLFYIGATQQLLATFFSLLAIHANLANQKVREVTFFILSLLSKELALRLVPVIILLRWLKGEKLVTAVKKSSAMIVITLVYLALRYLTGITTPPEYRFDLRPLTTTATVMWYGLMSLGAPEQILTYGLSGGRVDFLGFLRDFPLLSSLNLIGVSLLVVSLLFTKWSRRHFLYGLLWLTPLLPVLFLPTHRYAHYLDLSLVPLLALLLANKKKAILIIGVVAFIISSVSGQLIDRATHWTVKRAALAAKYTRLIQERGICQTNGVGFISADTKSAELSYALMNENGPAIICDNPGMGVYYGNYLEPTPNLPIIDLEKE